MKMIVAVLVVKLIISMFEKNKNVTKDVNKNNNRVIHPAEFEIR